MLPVSYRSSRCRHRPLVERLEDRKLFNVSSVFDNAGVLNTFIVHQDGSLTVSKNGGTETPVNLRAGVTVRVAHAYLDNFKRVALDVVYSDGQAYEYNTTGIHFIDSNVLDMSHAIGKNGQFRIDILYHDATAYSATPDQKGTLVTISNSGTSVSDPNVRWVSNYVDSAGNIGSVIGVIDAAANHLIVTRSDSLGTGVIYDSPDGATQDLTDYSQTSFNGKVVVDITTGRFAGAAAYEFASSGTIFKLIGNGSNVLVGG
jgi:hypothetical protein